MTDTMIFPPTWEPQINVMAGGVITSYPIPPEAIIGRDEATGGTVIDKGLARRLVEDQARRGRRAGGAS